MSRESGAIHGEFLIALGLGVVRGTGSVAEGGGVEVAVEVGFEP
jgi:hypothetical protein